MTAPPSFKTISEDLERRQAIPSKYREDLEARLFITCNPAGYDPPHKRNKTKRPSWLVRSQFKQRKAQQVYREVLQDAPHAFLPFILSASPKFCESFDPYEFCKDKKGQRNFYFGDDVKTLLQDIAVKQEISQTPLYLNMMGMFFPAGMYNTPFSQCP